MNERYLRNIGAISADDQDKLSKKAVLVVGCGGLGGYIIMNLARMGVGELRICDSDVFDETNLNRQLFSSEQNLGKSKAEETARAVNAVNSSVKVKHYSVRFDENTASEMLDGVDAVVDALDNVPSRLLIEKLCSERGIPMIFGAVSGWVGQVSTIMPGKSKLAAFYRYHKEVKPSVLPFAAAAIASYQSSETVKVLLDRPSLCNKLLLVDVEDNTVMALPF